MWVMTVTVFGRYLDQQHGGMCCLIAGWCCVEFACVSSGRGCGFLDRAWTELSQDMSNLSAVNSSVAARGYLHQQLLSGENLVKPL